MLKYFHSRFTTIALQSQTWLTLVIWGVVLFIVVIIAMILAEYVLDWLRSTSTRIQTPVSAKKSELEVLKELLQEMRALRKEIEGLRKELRE